MSDPKLLTPAEAAQQLAISERQLRKLTRAGRIKYVSVGLGTKRETRRYHPDDIGAFLEASTRVDTPATHSGRRWPRARVDASDFRMRLDARLAKRANQNRD